MVTIEIDAADIKFIVNLGIGIIKNATINNFESHSGNGKFVILI